jgi:hypothetical protein
MITSLHAPMKKDSATGKSGSYDFRRQNRTDDAEPFNLSPLQDGMSHETTYLGTSALDGFEHV